MARKYSLNLECPHCKYNCQFTAVASHILSIFRKKLTSSTLMASQQDYILGLFEDSLFAYKDLPASSNKSIHEAFRCTKCEGLIVVEWDPGHNRHIGYFPSAGNFKPKVNFDYIEKEEVKNDFKEAIDCYNKKLYNASMIMSRRTIQQEVLKGDLKKQIEEMKISENMRKMLHQVRIFGNIGAHPDLCLYDEKGNPVNKDDGKEFSEKALFFLDHYFMDQYEIPKRVENQPKDKKRLSKNSS